MKTALVLVLVVSSAIMLAIPAEGGSADVGPFSGKAGDGEKDNLKAEYYTHSNGVYRPAIYIYLDDVPAIQASVTISTNPVQKIEPVGTRSQFAVYLDRPLDMSGSPYHLMLNVFGKGDYIADCYIHVYGSYSVVTFDPNGGSGTMEPVEIGSGSYVLPSCGFMPPDGMMFDCWMADGVRYSVGDTIGIDSDTVVLAVWKVDNGGTHQIGITVSPFGSGAVTGAGAYRSGETATLKASAGSGYSFIGWFLDGAMVSDSPSYAFIVTSDASFTAKFVRSGTDVFVYSVTYVANGGYDAPAKQFKTSSMSGATLNLSQSVPKHSELSFKGWSDSPGGQVRYLPGDAVTLYSSRPDLILYAVWGEKSSPSSITVQYDSLTIPVGSSVTLTAEVVPADSDHGTLVWSSSDESIAVVSQDGTITALKEGTAVITVSTIDGSVYAQCSVNVVGSGDVVGTIGTDGGGSVEHNLIEDDDGNTTVGNPIVVVVGESGSITYDQEKLVMDAANNLVDSGEGPEIVVITTSSPVGIPWSIFNIVSENHGSLTVVEGNVTLFFSSEVLRGMGVQHAELVICVVPMLLTEVGVDVSNLPNCSIYDIYITINGTRVSMSFPAPVIVAVDYELEEGLHPGRLYVYHLDPEPMEKVQFEFVDGIGVTFGVMHFSLYAVGHENESKICIVWAFLLLVLAALIIVIAVLRRRDKEDDPV